MYGFLENMKEKVLGGGDITKEEALKLYSMPLEDLTQGADMIRRKFCSDTFDICTIINAKSGRCSENCKFCAQSSHNHTGVAEYSLLTSEEILQQAKYNDEKGVLRYSIVTSGRALSDRDIEEMCETVKNIKKNTSISVCISFGLLTESQYRRLKEAGVTRVHNNLETSEKYFPNICTTHSFQDKVDAIKAAQRAGLSLCSGGIMGLGETVEDRVDMAFSLKELGISSVPINILNPIGGTPFEKNPILKRDDVLRIVAVYRFILPGASIRLAGGRGLLEDQGASAFLSGANAVISGDMLTTAGISIDRDKKMIEECGYKIGTVYE